MSGVPSVSLSVPFASSVASTSKSRLVSQHFRPARRMEMPTGVFAVSSPPEGRVWHVMQAGGHGVPIARSTASG